MNTNGDRIVLLESTDGNIRITATEQNIYIVTPFNAAFKDELKARFGARWNGSTREWSIALRYRDALDPLLYNFYGVSMIAEVTTPSLMNVAIDAYGLYRASGAVSEITLAGSRVAVRWGRDEAVKVYRGVFKKDGEDFRFPRSGGSMRRPRVAGCGELDGATLETEITPAEMEWLRENEVNFELLDGGESADPQPEDTQLGPEDMSDIHADDEIWDEDEYHIYVQEEEDNTTEVESEVENESDEDKEEQEMNSYHVKANGSASVMWSYTTPAGVHVAVYPGWDGDAEIVNAGGWVDGRYIASSEVEQAGLWDRLSDAVKSEMEPLAGDDPAEWNGKILELRVNVSHEDAELLDALWVSAEVFGGSVTVYGTDDDVTKMDYQDLTELGLHRLDSEDEDEDEDEVDMF